MSRFDSVGLFWADAVRTNGNSNRTRIQPAIPDTGWTAPKEFPNLSAASTIALDTETWDPDLEDYGPGWARGVGHIVGISVAVPEGKSWYFPMRHTIEPETNMNPEHVLAWARDALGDARQPKVGANITYDIGWLHQEGVTVRGELHDVQFAEALLDETAQVALEVLGQKYLHQGKETSVLYQWLADFYMGKPNGKQRKNIYRAPPRLVGPYAEQDAILPMEILKLQYPLLQAEGLMEVYNMECGLIRLMHRMRCAGVRVDPRRAEQLGAELLSRENKEQAYLDEMCGMRVDINSPNILAKAFDKFNIPYGVTAKTKAPSFTKAFLEGLEHPIGDVIRDIRKYQKLRGTFVESYVLDSNIDGMVYASFHQLRGDGGGTRSGRLSSSDPNLQNVPSRDEEIAPMVRGLFVPDHGHKQWRRYDYAQIEYRFLIHYATELDSLGNSTGADALRRYFNQNPNTDYHDMVLDLVAPVAGWDVTTKEQRKHYRKPLKTINFGLIYGMGQKKLGRSLGLTKQEATELFEQYHLAVPFARATMDACSEEAQKLGTIATIMGRKSRFDMWEERGSFGSIALTLDKALLQWPAIQRARTHIALNRRLQGSSADMMKLAMWNCEKQGIFDYIGVPRLTVHDELDFSDPGGVDDGFAAMKLEMETCMADRLSIPIKADEEVGPDWGNCK